MTRLRASSYTARCPASRTVPALVAAFAMALAGFAAAAPARDARDLAGPNGQSVTTRVTATRAQAADPLKTLPAACRFGLSRGEVRGTWYGRKCLVAQFAAWPFLPDLCERSLDLPRRRPAIAAYDAACLAIFGFGPGDGRPPARGAPATP